MRMSRRTGVYNCGKRTVIVSVYGAANETVTLTHSNGTVITATTDSNGYAGTKELKVGSYTVNGSVSKFSRSSVVNKDTTMVAAFPDNTYFWHGYKGNVGGWTRSGYVGRNAWKDETCVASVGTSLYVKSAVSGVYYWYNGAAMGSVKPIDVTNLKKIVFRASGNDSYYCEVGITKSPSSCFSNGKFVNVGASNDYTIDVSGMTGQYYPFLSAWVYESGVYDTTVTRIYGE